MSRARGVRGWWFAAKDADGKVCLPHGDGREVKAGETLTVTGKIVACEHGLHASRRAIDALEYAPIETAIICRVRLSGEIVALPDKLAASERTVIWMSNATETLHRFAVWCAREALMRERTAKREPDPRSWAVLEVKERWLNGQATTEELAAARGEARAAAWEAARAAARAAAWEAAWAAAWEAARTAARAAAWEAARAAAWAAAWEAAREAAREAAWEAARAAARAAAWDAAMAATREAQNKKLETMLRALPNGKAKR